MILLAAAWCLSLQAQDRTAALKQLLEGSRVSFTYALTTTDNLPIRTDGTALIDGACYRISGNGLDIYCDGSTKWTVDTEAREVYLETSDGTREFLADPAAWLGQVHNLTVGERAVSGVFVDPAQGTEISFRFTSITGTSLSGSTEGFSFDVSSLGKDWIITDLR